MGDGRGLLKVSGRPSRHKWPLETAADGSIMVEASVSTMMDDDNGMN
jgi:hypothetical protein